jgi:hypothetical protein
LGGVALSAVQGTGVRHTKDFIAKLLCGGHVSNCFHKFTPRRSDSRELHGDAFGLGGSEIGFASGRVDGRFPNEKRDVSGENLVTEIQIQGRGDRDIHLSADGDRAFKDYVKALLNAGRSVRAVTTRSPHSNLLSAEQTDEQSHSTAIERPGFDIDVNADVVVNVAVDKR